MDNVKQVAITGSAVSDYMGGGGRKTRRGRRAAQQQGGDNEDPVAPFEKKDSNARLNIIKTGGASAQPSSPALNPPVGGINAPLNPPTLMENKNSSLTAPIVPVPPLQGGKQKVVLAPKQKTKKVVLAPKHQQKLHLPYKKPHKQTIRRVCLPINVIKTKIAKTRRHIKDSQSMDIDKIRKELIASKLLNPASKAPEALLRKIYADVKIIGTN